MVQIWNYKDHRNLFVITGIVYVLIGLINILNPFDSTRIIVILIGIYAIAYGVFSIINAIKEYTSIRY